MPETFFARFQRPRFHLLTLYTGGEGLHEIDFVHYYCQAGTLLHVHPGQVIRYRNVERAEATLVLFKPEFIWAAGAAEAFAARADAAVALTSYLELAGAPFEALRATLEAIGREYEQTDAGKVSEAIMRQLLLAFLLQIDREAANARVAQGLPPSQEELFAQFRHKLDSAYASTRKVQDYADALGCSARTLNRASLAAAGVPVKKYIDQRVALEAKRLLAHTAMNVNEIGHALNFGDPTNFIKFFRREAGVLPGEFRKAHKF
ncbi:MAG TPA: AraC family transcriptional regulator [Oscillatoriaceae cyanobacterium]